MLDKKNNDETTNNNVEHLRGDDLSVSTLSMSLDVPYHQIVDTLTREKLIRLELENKQLKEEQIEDSSMIDLQDENMELLRASLAKWKAKCAKVTNEKNMMVANVKLTLDKFQKSCVAALQDYKERFEEKQSKIEVLERKYIDADSNLIELQDEIVKLKESLAKSEAERTKAINDKVHAERTLAKYQEENTSIVVQEYTEKLEKDETKVNKAIDEQTIVNNAKSIQRSQNKVSLFWHPFVIDKLFI